MAPYLQLENAFMSPGEMMFALTEIDPRKRVNEALVDLAAVFLDRGAAKVGLLLASFALSETSWFLSKIEL